ncbi:Tetratricopeptide repeat-containing protein [Ligilactobacillus sp. WC1T17]|uniref:Tetratricopeptide repeat-containing protein n=1 Tax=Ligilactobacillus ruminis TaxID=1623 RepID=A0ABY1AAC4_9LACO|nr:Tetratricopeptide repeat-containing protein [Ligilactobacillus ruminis]
MAYSQKVLDLLEKGQLEEAKKAFGWALRKDDDQMLYSLAEELYSLGFTKQAKRAYQKLLDRYPDEDGLKVALAEIEINDGHDDQALDLLAQVSATSDAYIESLMVEADLYQTQGIFDVSEQKLLEAYRMAPDESVIRFALAELYFNTKEYRKASQYYLSLIEEGILTLSQVNLVSRLGLSYAGFGKLETALGYLQQIPADKLDDDALFQLAFIQYQQKDFDNAQKNFEKLSDKTPDYATVYPYLTDIYSNQGDLTKALITAQEGLSFDEFNEDLYLKAADLSLKTGNPSQAEAYLKKALTINPDSMPCVLALSNLLVDLKRYDEVIDLVQAYLQADEIDPQLYWNLGQAYAAKEDYEAAEKYYNAASSELNESLAFLKDAAVFYRNAGRRERALAYANKYLKQNPNDLDVVYLLDELE